MSLLLDEQVGSFISIIAYATRVSTHDKHTDSGCETDDLISICTETSKTCGPGWSTEIIKSAPADIARVQRLISHLMLLGSSNVRDELTTDSDDTHDSDDEITHEELILSALHDQCHTLLKGLQRHLELLFHHFKYTPLSQDSD